MASANTVAANADQLSNKQKWKTVIFASLGGGLEIYDFIIYGVFAREIARQFFPSADPIASLASTFGVFAIGYVSRPLGAIVLSSLGDRFGRRGVFLLSVLVMSAATIGIGLIPSYESIGVAAPILLISLRVVQGFFLAGELPTSITYCVEEMPGRASFVSALVIFCVNSGALVATLMNLALHTCLDPTQFAQYGWRIAFIFGGVTGLVSFVLRSSLEESKEFQKLKGDKVKSPFRVLLRVHPVRVLVGVALAAIVNTSNSMLLVVLPSYLTTLLHYDAGQVSAAQNIGLGVMAVSLIGMGWLGDKIPPRFIHRTGCMVFLVGAYPFYSLIVSHNLSPMATFAAIGIAGGLINGSYAFLLADLFPTNIRLSGVALSLNLATVVFTGMTPLAVTQMVQKTGLLTSPGLLLAAVAALSIAVGSVVRRYGGQVPVES